MSNMIYDSLYWQLSLPTCVEEIYFSEYTVYVGIYMLIWLQTCTDSVQQRESCSGINIYLQYKLKEHVFIMLIDWLNVKAGKGGANFIWCRYYGKFNPWQYVVNRTVLVSKMWRNRKIKKCKYLKLVFQYSPLVSVLQAAVSQAVELLSDLGQDTQANVAPTANLKEMYKHTRSPLDLLRWYAVATPTGRPCRGKTGLSQCSSYFPPLKSWK